MDFPWIHASIQAAAVLIAFGRGLWHWYPAWSTYLLIATTQSLTLTLAVPDPQRQVGAWAFASPFILLGLLDSVLELFIRLSRLYLRFRRDRWRWLVLPVVAGATAGVAIVSRQLSLPSNVYTAMFLAHAIVGAVCSSILLLGWIASTPVRIPMNLRKHLALVAIYVGTNTVAFANYLGNGNAQLIQNILNFMPPVVTLAWALLLNPQEETQRVQAEAEMPDSTLEQLLGVLKRLT